MTTKQTQFPVNVPARRPLKERFMHWLRRVLIFLFVLVGVIGIAAIFLDAQRSYAQIQAFSLQDVNRGIAEEIDRTFNATRQAAGTRAAREFALETASVSSSVERYRAAQQGMSDVLSALIQQGRGDYLAARYIDQNGSIWLETVYDPEALDGVAINPSIDRRGRSPQDDPSLKQGLLAEFGAVEIADLTVREDPVTGTVIPLLTVVSPITRADMNVVLGIIEVEVDGSRAFNAVRSASFDSHTDYQARRFLLVDEAGRVLADSQNPTSSYLLRLNADTPGYPEADTRLFNYLSRNTGDFTARYQPGTLNLVGAGKVPFNMPWRTVIVDNVLVVFGRVLLSASGLLIISLLIAVILLYVADRRLTMELYSVDDANQQLQQLIHTNQQRHEAYLSATAAPSTAMPEDEGEQIRQAANVISHQLGVLNEQIEQQAKRYERNLSVAANISRETATLKDIDQMLNRAIELISTAFGLYHAQVFLVDEAGLDAVLAYSLGEAGQRLLAQRHKLPVGSKSVIGAVTATGHPVIVNDTGETKAGETHAFNPILKDTRAEMALPLRIGDNIIGALDLQSNRPNAFQESDQQTYQLLADQIAIAVYKTRLLRQSEQRVRQIENLNRQLTQMAWEELEREVGLDSTYRYNLLEVQTDDDPDDHTHSTAQMIAIPIRIRGEAIGLIRAAPPEGAAFTENDRIILRSVAERVSLAVENARLFQETQTNLVETSTLYQTSRYLNEAETMRDIVEAIIVSAMPDAIAGQIAIFDDYADQPVWLEIITQWHNVETAKPPNGLEQEIVGQRFSVPDSTMLQSLSPTQVMLIEDCKSDTRIDPTMFTWFERLQAGAAVFIPLSVRGVWRGVLGVQFANPRRFGEREGRVYANLIDQAGVAIENRLLLRQTEHMLNTNERLYAASRTINQAQSMVDLVRAAVQTSNTLDINFGLGLFEGKLDESGWSTRMRLVAQSDGARIEEPGKLYQVQINEESPLHSREPLRVLCHEVQNATEAQLAEILKDSGSYCGVVFPLFSGLQAIALFFAGSRSEGFKLSDEDVEIYRAIAGQMSTVIQNRQLLESTAQALDETHRLYEAGRSLTNAQDVAGIYYEMISHLKNPNVTLISVWLADPEPSYDPAHLNRVYAWAANNADADAVRYTQFDHQIVPFSELPALAQGTTPITHLKDFPDVLDYLEANSTHSLHISPLETNQSWLGLVMLESAGADVFNEQYRRFTQAVTDQVAIALENQLLFDQAQQEARQALALAEASQLANQVGREITEGINTLFARVAETAGYDRWLLMELDEEGNRLEIITQRVPAGTPAIVDGALDLSTADHPIADAVFFNRTLMTNDPQVNPSLQNRPQLAEAMGKHIATPIVQGERVIGALIVGRSLDDPDLSERDNTLIDTLAAQVAVTIENQRLFLAAESERSTLRSILNTLPAGVLVLDAQTLRPVQFNAKIHEYLGLEVTVDQTFSAQIYDLYRTGTNLLYPNEELPIFVSLNTGNPAFCDDASVIREGYRSDLLINAAPIRNSRGDITNIVAAFEDISNLRNLENTLQDNLRETISLYEATRALAEADELQDLLDVILFQLMMNEPENAHVVLFDEESHQPRTVRSMSTPLADVEQLSESILHPRRTITVSNLDSDTTVADADREILLNQGITAIATMPLRTRQREFPLGWLVLNYGELKHIFSPEDERFLNTLGDNAAVAMDNRYLFQSTQRALSETSALYSATNNISQVRDLNELSNVIRSLIEQLAPDIYAAYLMTDPSSPDNLEEMFNISMDASLTDFRSLLTRYGLFRSDNIVINDLQALENPSSLEQALIQLGNIRAFTSVSLRVKGMPDGRIFLAYHQPRNFANGEIRYLNAIADSASVVIDNIILLEQIQNALEETSTLYQASRALADATTAEDILHVVTGKLIGVHVDQVFVAMLVTADWHAAGATVQIVSSWQSEAGVDIEGITLTSEQFPTWSLLASPNVITIDDIQTDERLDDLERMGVESLDARSLAIIPLRVPTRTIGAIWISSRKPHRHNEREQRVYQAFAEQASLSLEASFLLEQTEQRARQLATSAEVSQIASSILDLSELMPRVVNLIQEQFGYDHVQIFLMDAIDEYAVLQASTGEAGTQLLSINHKLARGSQSVIGQVTERAEPIIALDTSDARVVHRPNPYLPLTRSEMALPILIKGKVTGALDVQSNQPNAFGDDDVAVLTTLAAQLSVAIDNARLFRQAEKRADEMSFLFTITTAAASADSLEDALRNVVVLLPGSIEAVAIGVFLVSEEDDITERTIDLVVKSDSNDVPEAFTNIPVVSEDNLLGTIARDLIPIIINDINDDPTYKPLNASTRSAIIVPLNSGGEAIGMVAIESDQVGTYNQDTLTLLLALSGTLAAIVQNARLLEDIYEKNEELRTLDRLKSDFLANMSHELRTPLNSIIGFSRVMLKGIDGELTEMQEQDLNTIYNSGQHLLGLINDILDQAKIAADKMDLQREYFDMRQVLEGVRSIGIGLLKEKPVEILLKIANNLPDAFGDEFRTRQVLLNLVSNSAKFTSEGNVTISAYLVSSNDGVKMIRIDVADTGIGIAKQNQALLFEAFQQVDSSLTRTVEGTGLGLPIARSLVELQGGEMTVDSELGMGSTFSLTVPTEPVHMDNDEADDDAEPTATNGADPSQDVESTYVVVQQEGGAQQSTHSGPPPGLFEQKRQILLIEDNPQLVDQYRRLLQREGFEIQVASDAFFAETMASGLRPTLIIMDVNFADSAGWNILKSIKDRDDTFDIPVIVVTMNDDSERAYRLGAHSFLSRPHTPDELLEAVLAAEQESNIDRILIIDDQPESTRLIEEVLQTHGKYRVFAAHTGPEGISLVARRRPDLIVLDLRMPEMDGFAVLDDLRSRPETASIPVVVVTGENTLSSDEREKLTNLEIIYKTDLNQENYQDFIDEVRRQITRYHGD